MGLPVGVEVGSVTFGSAVSYAGRTTSARLAVEPSARLVYNGIPLLNFVEEEVAANGQPGQMYLPVCDQSGFKATQNGVVVDFTNWSYTGTLTWTDPITKTSKSVTKVFQILSGQTVIDFDELPDSVNALPVTAPTVGVSSFLGKTGAIEVSDLDELDLGGGISKEEADQSYAPVALADSVAVKVDRWQPEKAYAAGAVVVNPFGDLVSAKVTFITGTEYNAGNWNLSASYAKPADIAAIAPSSGSRAVGRGDLFVNPYDYGAIGTGGSDDTAGLAAAYAAAVASGGSLIVPKGTFLFTSLAMTTPGVNLIGMGGTLKGGTVTVGTTAAQDFSGTTIDGVRFDGADAYSTTKKTLVLRNVRGLDIKNNRFFDTGKAISASTADGATGFHTLAMINIQGNRFKGVDYCVHVDTTEWDVCSDWTIADNYYNLAADSSIYMTGVASGGVGGSDGLTISRNVVFGLNYSQSATALFARKRHNVWIGKTNFLRITDNQFFEAGLSSLRLDTAKNFVISDNHFAWGGQREQGDGIEFRGGDLRGTIHGNTFEDWTRSAIAFYDSADVKRVEVGANTYKWQAAPSSWKGTGTLTTANCFRVFSDTTCVGTPVVRDWTPEIALFDSLGTSNRITSRDQKGTWGGVSGAVRRSATIVAATTLGICLLSDFLSSAQYGGLVVVTARKLDGSGNVTKIASYVLNVAPSGPNTCQTISAVGLTAGAAADEPSFTWTVSGATLNATPVASTAGAFFFEIESLGAVAAR